MCVSLSESDNLTIFHKPTTRTALMSAVLTAVLAPFMSGCAANVQASSTAGVSVASGNRSYPGGAPSDGVWTMTFGDDFNGTSVDTSTWTIDNDYLCAPSQLCQATRWADNVTVSNGLLHLTTHAEERVSGYPWTTGAITTKTFSQKYGYIEARIRYGAASGLNNALWLTSATTSTPSFEVDINEGHYSNEMNFAIQDISAHSSTAHTATASGDLASEFHVYGLEWDTNSVTWYYDGQKLWTTLNTIAEDSAKVHLSTMVLPWAGEPDTASLDGTSMDVDWIRVYSK